MHPFEESIGHSKLRGALDFAMVSIVRGHALYCSLTHNRYELNFRYT